MRRAMLGALQCSVSLVSLDPEMLSVLLYHLPTASVLQINHVAMSIMSNQNKNTNCAIEKYKRSAGETAHCI